MKADDWTMLLEFRVENHRSIQKEQALTLEVTATAGAVVQEGEPSPSTAPVLPVALIYGANASGKSNVLSALSFMKNAVFYSQRGWEPKGGIPRDPFAWGGRHTMGSLYEVTFLVDQIRVNYGFSVDDSNVLEEWLFAWPKGRKQTWFERDGTAFKFGEHLKGPNEAVKELTRENSLFLSAAAQQGHQQLTALYTWFQRVFSFVGNPGRHWFPDPRHLNFLFPQPTLFPVSEFEDAVAEQIRRLLAMADVGIVDLQVRSEDGVRGRTNRVLLQHKEGDEDSWLELEDESEGTVSLLRLATPLFGVLQHGGVLVIDELERSLHPSVCAAILGLFLRPETNPKNAQLIATTHDTALLGSSLGRTRLEREHIWFTEKDKSGATELYPLTDYKPGRQRTWSAATCKEGMEPSPFSEISPGSPRRIYSMGKRDRSRRPARRTPFKDVKPLLLVVTEGKVTEPEYLNGFARWCANPRVEIVVENGAGAPISIAKTAKRLKQAAEKRAHSEKDDNLRYDEVWCVFDVDDHPGLPEAKQIADSNGLKLAISNPRIELWLLLHFREQPGMQRRDQVMDMLKTHVPGYDKHIDFRRFQPNYDQAAERARRLEEECVRDGEEGRNPSTGFGRLTASIQR